MCRNPLGISVKGHVKRLNLILFKIRVVEIKKSQEETPDGIVLSKPSALYYYSYT